MSLYLLNTNSIEIKKEKQENTNNQKYKTEIIGNEYSKICVIALEEIITNLKKNIIDCEKFNQTNFYTSELDIDSDLLEHKNNFEKCMMKLKKLVKAFIKDCESIENEDTKYINFLIEQLNILSTEINFFSMLYDIKHGDNALKISQTLLIAFQDHLRSYNDTNSNSINSNNSNSHDKFL